MSDKIWLITMASWEERFVLGLDHILKNDNLIGITVLYSRAFSNKTALNRARFKKIVDDADISFEEVEIDFEDQIKAYLSLEERIADLGRTMSKYTTVLLDISTMPREIIWNCFLLCEDNELPTRWCYFPPGSYCSEWLTKEPDVPRMVLRKSGVTRYGKQTALVIITGFDSERAMKAISYFEPGVVWLGIQLGQQYENLSRNAETQRTQLKPELCNVSIFEIDAYQDDHGMRELSGVIEGLLSDYNVLLTSLGPKPSAITAYQITSLHPEVGLFYVPALEYSPNYSSGILIDEIVRGENNYAAIGVPNNA